MAFVHHTDSGNDYTAAEAPAIMRGVYAYHTKSLHWSDVGYNFLIDRYGTGRVGYRAVTAAVQRHVLPQEHNFVRHADPLGRALQSLHDTWSVVRTSLGANGEDTFRAREAAAMVAHSRWMYHAALQRTETRGMHKRVDHPEQDPAQRRRLLVGGLDEIWSRPESLRQAAAGDGGRAA